MSRLRTITPSQLAAALASPGCPDPARLCQAVAGELSEAEREALFAHAASCDACSAELDLARAFDAPEAGSAQAAEAAEIGWIVERLEARRSGEEKSAEPLAKVLPMRSRAAGPAAPARRWSLAAAASLLLAVGGLYVATRTTAPPTVPPPPSLDVTRSATLDWTTPLGRVATLPTTLAWSATPEARLYRIEARNAATRELLWQGESSTPSLAFPAELAARLAPFSAIELQVRALAADGAVLAISPAAELRLEPVR